MPLLNVAGRIVATEAEGPGVRYALWVQGCPLRCAGCCNPGMLPFTPATRISADEVIAELAGSSELDGVTFLGGEPFAQAEPLAKVARAARELGLSVLVFSGYSLEELRRSDAAGCKALLAATDLLVDGRYVEGTPSRLRFIGSANQRLRALTERGAVLARSFERGPDVVEVRIDGARVTVNGTPGH